MKTLIFQMVVTLLALLFGIVALFAGRKAVERSNIKAVSWIIAGVSFTIGGVCSALQDAGAVWAFLAGPESTMWEEYVRWAPAGNHGRSFLRVATGVILAVAALRPAVVLKDLRFAHTALVSAFFLGGLFGWLEGPLRSEVHFTNAAVVQVVECVSILLALFLGALRSSLDRLLFLVLGIYAFRQALNVLSLTAFAWLDTIGVWAPDPVHTQIYGTAGYIAMIGIALYRLVLARRGVQVPGLLDPALGSQTIAFR